MALIYSYWSVADVKGTIGRRGDYWTTAAGWLGGVGEPDGEERELDVVVGRNYYYGDGWTAGWFGGGESSAE